jgi:hypothetical protein
MFIPGPIRNLLQDIVFTVPTGFSTGSQKVVWQGINSHIEVTPPSITTKDISLLGLLGEIKFPIGSILGKFKIPSFALDLGLNQLAFDPNFDSGQFQDLAMADMNQSIPGDQPDEWEALLRAEVLGYKPTPEVMAAAKNDIASAPVTGTAQHPNAPIGTGASGHWDSKDRWETAAKNDSPNDPSMAYNGADFLTLDTMIKAVNLSPSLAGSQSPAVLVPNPVDPSKTDLQVHGTSGPDTITLIHHDGGAVEVVMNGSSLGTFTPTADIHVHGGSGDDQITIQGNLGHPTYVSGDDGNDTIILAGGAGPGVTIDGGSGSNTLIGDNVDTTWWIKGPGSGSLSTGASFSNIQNLTGGSGADFFYFAGGGSISGNIDGKGGGNTLDFSFALAQNVTLSAEGAIDGYNGIASGSQILGGSFSNIGTIIGSVSQMTSSLMGLNSDATWTVVAPPNQTLPNPNPPDPSSIDALAATSHYTLSSDGRSLSFGNFGTLNGGSGVDTFNIRSTGAALTANGNAGNDVFVVSSTAGIDNAGDLGNIGGQLTIDAGSGDANRLIIRDFNSTKHPNAVLTKSELTGFGPSDAPSAILYSATGGHFTDGANDDGILISGSDTGPDVFHLQSTLAGSTTKVKGNGGNDTFDVGDQNHSVDDIAGLLTVDGGNTGGDVMNVDDTGSSKAKTGTLTPTALTGLGMGPDGIRYAGLANLNINLGSGGNTFNINDINPATHTSVDGGTSNNDTVKATFAQDFNGQLDLTSFEHGTVQVNRDFNGTLTDTKPGHLESVNVVNGSITPTGKLTAGSIDSLVIGPNHLSVGQNMAGQVNVAGTLGSARIAGGTPGLFTAGHVGTIAAFGGYGPVVLRVIEYGVQRQVQEATPANPYPQPNPNALATTQGNPNYINTQYLYESGSLTNPQLTARISNPVSTAPDQYDLSLVAYSDTAQFNLARLDANGVAGVRNIAVEGNVLTGVTSTAANFFGLPAGAAGGIHLPQDNLAGVGIADNATQGSIQAQSIQAVAMGSLTGPGGLIGRGSGIKASDAETVLARGTALVQAKNGETYRVPFADNFPVNFFLDTYQGLNSDSVLFTDQAANDPRGAVTALITAAVPLDSKGQPPKSQIQRIDMRGDGGSLSTWALITQAITSTGSLGDLTLQNLNGLVANVTASSIAGSIHALNGPITGTIQTTGLRTDPITGQVQTVAADFGQVTTVQTRQGPVVTTTTVQAGRGGIQGQLISRGNLLSQIIAANGISGLIAAQGDIGASTPAGRAGGIVSNGPVSGQIVALGTIRGDVIIHGSLLGGITAKGGIVGNTTIDGSIGSTGAVVSGGAIGNPSAGAALSLGDDLRGIVAAEGGINSTSRINKQGGYLGANLATTDAASKAAIDAIFTNGGHPLTFDSNGLDLGGLRLILQDLSAQYVKNGKLTGTTA